MANDTYSQANSNFADSMSGGVDARTGVFAASLHVVTLKSNGTSGPHIPLTLRYDPSNPTNMGFGKGWAFSWATVDENTSAVTLSTGDKYIATMKGGNLILKDQKVINAGVFNDDKYVIKHRNGEQHYMDMFSQGNIRMPSRITTACGLGVNLEWNRGRQLLNITDDYGSDGAPLTMVNFDYSGDDSTVVTLWPGTTAQKTLTFNLVQDYLVSVQVTAGNVTNTWAMEYSNDSTSFSASPLIKITYPSGAVESVTYCDDRQGHKYPNASGTTQTVQYVTDYVKSVNGVANDRKVSYSFSPENYLGYNGDISVWSLTDDNTYGARDDYQYTSTVVNTDDDGSITTTVNTYNKFHLLMTSSVVKNDKSTLTTNTYPISSGGFEDQDANFQLPVKVEIQYTDGSQPARIETTLHEYALNDGSGNKTKATHPDGTVETWTYYDADSTIDNGCLPAPLAVPTFLKSYTVTSPAVNGAPTAPVKMSVHTYGSLDDGMGGNAVVPQQVQEYVDGTNIRTTEYGYINNPTDVRHGRINSHVTTVYTGDGKSYTSKLAMNYVIDGDGVQTTTTTQTHDGLSRTTVTTSDPITGSALTGVDALKNVVSYTYDPMGRVASHIMSGPNSSYKHEIAYTYGTDDDGVIFSTATDPNNVTIKSRYTGEGRLYQSSLKIDEGIEQITRSNQYDSSGRLTSTSMYDNLMRAGIDALSGDIKSLAAAGVVNDTQEYIYDDWGQHTQSTIASGGQVTEIFDPTKLQSFEQIGFSNQSSSKLTSYDQAHHPQQLDINNKDSVNYASEYYIYDGSGRRISHTDTMGFTTSYAYDAFDRLIQTTLPDGRVVSKTYAPYSAKSLVTSISITAGSKTVQIGSQQFDGFDRIVTRTVGGRTYKFSYTGDASTKPALITLPDGNTLTYVRIAALGEAVQTVTAKDGTYRSFKYDPITGLATTITQSDKGGKNKALEITQTYTLTRKLKTKTISNYIDGTVRLITYEYSMGG